MHFHAADGTGGNEALPFFIGRWRIQQKRNHRFDFANFARGKAAENPKPLAVIGRVITFQNSEIFCRVK